MPTLPPRVSQLAKTCGSSVVKRSVVIADHKTSVSLEDDFWSGLKSIASLKGQKVADVLVEIDSCRTGSNLSSAVRLFVLGHYKTAATDHNLNQSRHYL
jgi:predicted DNA-binding ribbon-helix-helix protein